jgi:hypothetical protein
MIVSRLAHTPPISPAGGDFVHDCESDVIYTFGSTFAHLNRSASVRPVYLNPLLSAGGLAGHLRKTLVHGRTNKRSQKTYRPKPTWSGTAPPNAVEQLLGQGSGPRGADSWYARPSQKSEQPETERAESERDR